MPCYCLTRYCNKVFLMASLMRNDGTNLLYANIELVLNNELKRLKAHSRV